MRIAGTASALAFAALLACPTLAQAAPQFTSMNVALYSLDRGKPGDARVEQAEALIREDFERKVTE